MYESLLKAANQKYKELKMKKHPYAAPETIPEVGDTAKAILYALSEQLKTERRKTNACRT